tara:strand:+ start:349 stop:657 length:309 start_codon:yes stop_codon:yes gene_type:complete
MNDLTQVSQQPFNADNEDNSCEFIVQLRFRTKDLDCYEVKETFLYDLKGEFLHEEVFGKTYELLTSQITTVCPEEVHSPLSSTYLLRDGRSQTEIVPIVKHK